jgi:hypothetical protein
MPPVPLVASQKRRASWTKSDGLGMILGDS